jgi:hypothetical protein
LSFTLGKEDVMETARTTTATTFKFTASIVMAIEAMTKLVSFNGLHVHPRGASLTGGADNLVRLPRPNWGYQFDFFNRISASPIRRKNRVKAHQNQGGEWVMSHWIIEREVQFEHKGAIVAKVWLEGYKPDGTKGNRDNNTCWAVSKIVYAMDILPSNCSSGWNTTEVEVMGHRGTSCAFLD